MAEIDELIQKLTAEKKKERQTLVNRRGYQKGQLTKIETRLSDVTELNALHEGILETLLQTTTNIQEKFDKFQTELEEKFEEIELVSNERETFDARVCNVQGTIRSFLIDKKNVIIRQEPAPVEAQQLRVSSSMKLAKLPPPRFDGQRKSWIPFKNSITRFLDSGDFDDGLKYQYLENSVRESSSKALRLVQSSNSVYETAWSKLLEEYDNDVMLKGELISELYDVKRPAENDAKSLQEFIDTVELSITQLKSINEDVTKSQLLLVYHLTSCLDLASKRELEKHRDATSSLTYENFMKFLRLRIQILENLAKFEKLNFEPNATSTPAPKSSKQDKNTSRKPNAFSAAASASNEDSCRQRQCLFCKADHSVFQCEAVKSLTIQQRIDKVKQLNLCFNCLKPGHSCLQCQDTHRCKNCGSKHHTILHRETTQATKSNITASTDSTLTASQSQSQLQDQSQSQGNISASASTTISKSVILATALVLVENAHGVAIPARAFLDSGSTTSFMTYEFLNKLGLKKQPKDTTIYGINGSESKCKFVVSATVRSRFTEYEFHRDFIISPKTIIDRLPVHNISMADMNLPKHEELADPSFHTPAKIDILLGAETFFEIIMGESRHIGSNLYVYPTQFGYIVGGSLTKTSNIHYTHTAIEELKAEMQKFWEMETLQTKLNWSLEEIAAEESYKNSVKRLPNQHYEVSLPFNNQFQRLGVSADAAKRIFLAAERRRIKFPERQKAYQDFMNEMIALDHMQLVEHVPEQNYFMVHHMVSKISSLTTKHRVVFNASFPTSTGISLNDSLLVGPQIQNELFSHLIRWRLNPVGLVSDVRKMYRQIHIRPQDQQFQMVWWRNSPSEPLRAYKLTTVTYGTSSAPFQATRTLKQLSMDEIANFPDVAHKFDQNFFVDDYVDSVDSREQALQVKQRMSEMGAKGGFTLCKWSSNAEGIDDEIVKDEGITSILGVPWNRKNDTIYSNFSAISTHKIISRSSILSEISQLFDPLGLAAPIVLKAKILMQNLWQLSHVSWEEPLPSNFSTKWENFRNQLKNMKPIVHDRALLNNPEEEFDLHGFCDASDEGFGASVYLVTVTRSTLICAKSRVAPLKRLTTPRLELNAAVLLANLMDRIRKSLPKAPKNEYMWSDSEITLFRIKSHPGKYPIYVGTRVAEIQQLSNPLNWLYVPTAINPADILSRGCTPSELENNNLWWHGPEFLLSGDWPLQTKFELKEPDPEEKKISLPVHVKIQFGERFSRFSSYNALVSAVARIVRLSLNSRKNAKYRNRSHTNTQERQEAEMRIIRIIQREAFAEEIRTLKAGKMLSKSSILNLNPYLDEDGLLRVGGRLRHTSMQFDNQHQIIIPKGKVALLILRREHFENNHCGPQLLISSSRQKFWIIGCRDAARKLVHRCVVCFHLKPILLKQLMSDIPRSRTTPTRPFSRVGVDFAGPFHVRPFPRARYTIKMYICLYTCFVTRATHLEVVKDLTTKSFLASFRRFTARRSRPAEVVSDNATNFVGARRELKELYEFMLDGKTEEEIHRYCSSKEIVWTHIPPRTPHFGALWESMVKQMKYHLYRVTRNLILTPESLETISCEVEAVLNSRPLTPLSQSVDDYEPLTPGHFLVGGPLNSLPTPDWSNRKFNRLDVWQQQQYIVCELWKKFTNDYVNELQKRSKWTTESSNIAIGMLVLVHDDNLPPCQWKLARVIELYKGKDERIRVVKLRMVIDGKTTEFVRPIVKIAPLPIYDEEN